MPETISIYVTCKDEEEAKKIARHLVEEKLVACCNILPVTSIFRWHDTVQEEYEFAFLAKTTADKFEAAKEAIKKLHSYDLPCIVALPHQGIDGPYGQWVKEETDG